MLRIVVVSAMMLPILGGCAVTNVKMANDKGQTGKCSAFGAGIIGTVVALGMTQNCVDEYKKQGFQEVPNTPPGSAVTTSTDQKK
jgi:hypothetical protein